MLTPSHCTDEAPTFSFLSKLQWSSCTSFMNSHIHWVPPSGCLFADTSGLGKWKSCFPQVPWLIEKKKKTIQHLVANTALCWKWQTQLNLEAETSLPLHLLFCWLNGPISSNFPQHHISTTTLSRLCGQLQPWWYLTTPLGMPNLRDKEPTAAPRVLTKLKCLYQKEILETDWILKSQDSSSRVLFCFPNWWFCLQTNQQNAEWSSPVGGLHKESFILHYPDESRENSWAGCSHLELSRRCN